MGKIVELYYEKLNFHYPKMSQSVDFYIVDKVSKNRRMEGQVTLS